MPTKRHLSEQIISRLRDAEVPLAQETMIPLTYINLGIHLQTYDKRPRDYGGLQMGQAKRLKDLKATL